MNLKFWRRQEKKQIDSLHIYGSSVYIPGVGRILADRLYNYILAFRLSDMVYSCVTKIQLAAIVVPWYVYQQKGDEVIEIEKHPLVDFLKWPSARMSWSRYIETYLGHLLLTGNSYQWLIVPSFKTKAEIKFLRPDRVTPKLTTIGAIRYEYRLRGKLEIIPEEEVIHSKLFNPEEDEEHLEGFSPVVSIAKSIDIASYAQEWMFRLLEKGAQPPIALSTEKSLTDEQKKYLKEQIKSEVLGPENAMNPLILEGGLKPEKIGFGPRDMTYEPILKSILRRVANVYGVPSELLGDSENKTYSNVQEAEKALYYKVVLPHLTDLRDELNFRLVSKLDDSGLMFIDYDTSGIDALAEDMERIWERAGKAVDKGIITRNEAREMMKYGRSEEPGMDKPTVAATVMPLDVLIGEEREEE